MSNKIYLTKHPVRKSSFYSSDDKAIPPELFTIRNEKPCLDSFPYPLPSAINDYKIKAESDGIIWLGASTGLTRYEPNAEFDFNIIQFFSADRDLFDNNIKALLPDGRNVWVLTDKGAVYIEEKLVTPKEICDIQLEETLRIVDRHGMISQKKLAESRNLESFLHDGHSDNDGGFTAIFDIAEILRYAYMKREKGAGNPETIKAKQVATRALEAVLLLSYVHGRGDGFVARSYSVTGERLPDDGLFFKRHGDKSHCIETNFAKSKKCVNYEVNANSPIPERLRHLFTDEGFTEDDITYKADTSSDEITIEMLCFLFAHEYLTKDDPELDKILIQTVKNITNHIIDNNFRLADYSGESTTWARWYPEYFHSEDGYVDGALNSAELLFYLKATMHITGEEGKWLDTYNKLINEYGYADLTTRHFDRMYQLSIAGDSDFPEEIMYGDHMLACCSFLGLCLLEKDEELLAKYRYGFKSWRSSLDREDSPHYDYMFALACPDEEINTEYFKEWFCRSNLSRLASGVSLVGRHDIPKKVLRQGYTETSCKLPLDERFIAKLDRDPREYKNEDSGGTQFVETCCVYSLSYWLGKNFGFIEDGE